MVNRVCEPDTLLPEALDIAMTIAGNAPISIRQAKRSMHHGLSLSLADGMLFEIESYNPMAPRRSAKSAGRSSRDARPPS